MHSTATNRKTHIYTPGEKERDELPMDHNSRDRYTAQLLGILRSFMKAIK